MFIINEFQIFNSWIFQSFSKHFSGRREYRWLSGKESTCQVADGVQSLGWEDPLDVEMATHSSILAWEFPWTEEPGRLQSMGSQKLDMI